MRRLKSADLFAAMRFAKTAGLREQITEIALKARENGGAIKEEELGAEMIVMMFEGASDAKAEEKLYEFLAGPFEMPVEEIRNMELLDLFNKFAEFKDIEDVEGWSHFFSLLANLMK